MSRVYLDWNATAPLRPEARDVMIAAMGVVGNPSSVHGEGRAARAIIERARAQVAAAAGARVDQVVFTSSATEAAAMVLAARDLSCGGVEHDCVALNAAPVLSVDSLGAVECGDPASASIQIANAETGILQVLPADLAMTDAVQAFGKIPFAFEWCGAKTAILSAHKIGGPKGVGAVLLADGVDLGAFIRGGGQEQGRRAGTENTVGIAGFGAAAEASERDLCADIWANCEKLRNLLEFKIEAAAPNAVCVGKDARRLPNTSCIAVPGWKGETQVMQMDLAGFAISAGSACSSGKVKNSKVLAAMGRDDIAGSAIRVSLGPTTTQTEVLAFADAWIAQYSKFMARAA
jgi:cysteine desulfurase